MPGAAEIILERVKRGLGSPGPAPTKLNVDARAIPPHLKDSAADTKVIGGGTIGQTARCDIEQRVARYENGPGEPGGFFLMDRVVFAHHH